MHMAGCIIPVRRIRIGTRALTYLLTQLAGAYKAGNISETVEDITACIKSYMGFRLLPKCMTLNDLREIQGH